MENPEVVRRQIFDKDGGIETDTVYSGYEAIGGGGITFPSKIEVQFVATDTILKINVDPKDMHLNESVDADAFMLSTHKGAEVITFEPRDLVSQQR
jgi:hypothetical protein